MNMKVYMIESSAYYCYVICYIYFDRWSITCTEAGHTWWSLLLVFADYLRFFLRDTAGWAHGGDWFQKIRKILRLQNRQDASLDHAGFRSVALCPWNLQAVYCAYRQQCGKWHPSLHEWVGPMLNSLCSILTWLGYVSLTETPEGFNQWCSGYIFRGQDKTFRLPWFHDRAETETFVSLRRSEAETSEFWDQDELKRFENLTWDCLELRQVSQGLYHRI